MFAQFSSPVGLAVGVITHCLIPENRRDHAFRSLENQSTQSHCHGLAADIHLANGMVASGVMAGQHAGDCISPFEFQTASISQSPKFCSTPQGGCAVRPDMEAEPDQSPSRPVRRAFFGDWKYILQIFVKHRIENTGFKCTSNLG
ncbi:hypothetical protein BKA63DRAFT_494577 [Paraphoma chrysanthemicola]|nr:hypothetical protein BKA63DRAFT_494577 [Paraphoma chrysanthemicola]